MGEASRRKALKHPKKIRTRSDEEIAAVMIAYRNLYQEDPFTANLMILMSELSEYIAEIQINDEKKLKAFIEKNSDGLLKQFLRRFKSVTEYALPPASLAPEIFMAGGNRLLN